MKRREYYNAFVDNGEGMCLYLTNGNCKRNFKTYEEAMEAVSKAKYNYSKKDMKRTYPDGSYEWLSYNDQHNMKYYIEKHYDEYETLYEEDCPKTKSNLKDGKDEIEVAI